MLCGRVCFYRRNFHSSTRNLVDKLFSTTKSEKIRMATASNVDFDDVSSLKDLRRGDCADIAENTLTILHDGFYHVRGGTKIDLTDEIQYSVKHTELYTDDDVRRQKISTDLSPTDTPIYPKFEVRHCTTLQAAQTLAQQMGEDQVGILNFASAKNPGGGFRKGAKAQEESLARSSSLYLSLSQDRIFNGFYEYNRCGKNPIYSNRIIYTPRVTFFKNDNGKLLKTPFHVGVVTCPAPNAGVARDVSAVREAMIERIRRILIVFQMKKHTSIVLGAFGCGVFRNDPFEVAVLFRQTLETSQFKNSFQRVIFAVLDEQMYRIFDRVFTTESFIDLQLQLTTNERPNTRNQNRKQTQRRQTHRVYREAEETEI